MSDDRRLDIENAALAEEAARIGDSKFIKYFLDMGKNIEEEDLPSYNMTQDEANSLNQVINYIRQTKGIEKRTLGDDLMQGFQDKGFTPQRSVENGADLIELNSPRRTPHE